MRWLKNYANAQCHQSWFQIFPPSGDRCPCYKSATRRHHMPQLQIRPPDGASALAAILPPACAPCMNLKFGHYMAPPEMVTLSVQIPPRTTCTTCITCKACLACNPHQPDSHQLSLVKVCHLFVGGTLTHRSGPGLLGPTKTSLQILYLCLSEPPALCIVVNQICICFGWVI